MAEYNLLKEKFKFIKHYIKSNNAADGSEVDSNANVESKNVATLSSELFKKEMIYLNRYFMSEKLKELYGSKVANQYLEDLKNHIIYKHDETGSPGKPYCVSISMYPFLLNGLQDIGGESGAPKHLASYVGGLINLIYAVSAQFVGACLYKDQTITIKDRSGHKNIKIKDFVEKYNLESTFSNNQGDWEYSNVSDDISVIEENRFVKIKRVYRRKYKSSIYVVETKSGKKVKVSEDHRFKTIFRGREFDVCAKDLTVGDTLINTNSFVIPIDKKSKDYEIGQIIGIVAGDGCITNDNYVTIAINYNDTFISDRLDLTLEKHFGKCGILNNDNKCYKYDISSREITKKIRSYFNDCDRYDSYSKSINVEKYSMEFLFGFLDGILATNSGWSNGHSLSLANKDLIQNVLDILKTINMNSKTWDYQDKRPNRSKMFSVYINRAVNEYLDLTNIRIQNKKNYNKLSTRDREVYYYGKDTFSKSHMNFKNKLEVKLISDSNQKNMKDLNYDVIVNLEKIDNDCDFVYEIETESNWYSVGGLLTHNCALPEALMGFHYYAKKDYGDNYLETHESIIKNELQSLVYTINQPASNRGYQAAFTNFSVFDKYFFDSLFSEFIFPDGSKVDWEEFDKLQKFFYEWFQNERKIKVLTFPVMTKAMVVENGEFKDKEFLDWAAERTLHGFDTFYYQGPPSSLSSCCFDKNTRVVTKSSNGVYTGTFKELFDSSWDLNKKNLTILNNGSWSSGKAIKIKRNNKSMYKIVTSNKKEFIMTEDHINLTLSGNKFTKDLSIDDYLMFNTMKLDTYPEMDMKLTYEQGVIIGAYLGDGSMYKKEIHFSLNKEKYEMLMPIFHKGLEDWGISSKINLYKEYNNVYPVMIYGDSLINKIKYWVKGSYSNTKEINPDCLLQSSDFRRGIVDGIYITDGGNSNRIYTTSENLKNGLEILLTSLGKSTIIDESDRRNEKVIIRGEKFNRNHILYCIRWYDFKNKRSMKDVYKIRNNSIFFKIKSIKEIVDYKEEYVYCFEMKNEDDPHFTLPSGLQTHNCRLKNEIDSNEFSTTMGVGGVMTGSLSVMTLNIPRIAQICHRDNINFLEYIENKVKDIHMYQMAFKSIIEDYLASGMLPVYDAGFITIKKQFLTIGIIGLPEAYEAVYDAPAANTDHYKSWTKDLVSLISKLNKEAKIQHGHRFNTESVPGESLGIKLPKWDTEDGFKPYEHYSSYFFKPEDESVTIADKFILHGYNDQFLDGGSAAHIALDEPIRTKEQAIKLFEMSAKVGCSYWTANVKKTICNKCNRIFNKTMEVCPICGGEDLDWCTRIIGYLKRISKFSDGRRKEESRRHYHKSIL